MKIIKTGQTRSDAKRIVDVAVSDSDYTKLSAHNWQAMNNGTIYTRVNGRHVQMHRMIMDAPENMEVDHINGDRTDNRRENLRLCTSAENKCNRGARKDNTSGYKGVSWHKQRSKWTARIKTPYGKYLYLGLFENKLDAVEAYNNASIIYQGDFAFISRVKAL